MTRTQYYVASSLDGFIADRDGGLEWLLQFGFEAFQSHYDDFIAGVGALVMGAGTYEFILAEGPDAWTYGSTPTFVLTHRELPRVPGADIRFVSGEVGAVHAQAVAAAQERNVWIVGGGAVAAQWMDAELLDELHLTVMPVVLGGGTPVLPLRSNSGIVRLDAVTRFDGGAVELRYRLR